MREINTCNVSIYVKFNVIISNDVQLCSRDINSKWLHRVALPNLTIPLLANLKSHLFGCGSKFIVIERHTCPKKVNPVLWYVVLIHHSLVSCALQTLLEYAQFVDTHLLNSLLHDRKQR